MTNVFKPNYAILTTKGAILICSSQDGDFIRAMCADGERDITPGDDCDLDDPESVRFEVEHDLVGGWGQGVDWSAVEVTDER